MSIEKKIGRDRRLVVYVDQPQGRNPELRREGIVYQRKLVSAAVDRTTSRRQVITQRVVPDSERVEEFRPDLARLQSEDPAIQDREWERWYSDAFSRHMRSAMGKVRNREVATDLVHDTWERLRNALRIGEDIDENNLNGFARTILGNIIIDYFKRAETQRTSANSDLIATVDSPDVKGAEAAVEDHGLLMEAIDKLPPLHREQVIYFLAERSIREIAGDLGITEDAVKQRRSRALKILRDIITKGQSTESLPESEAEREQREREEKWFETVDSVPIDMAQRLFLITEHGLSQAEFLKFAGIDRRGRFRVSIEGRKRGIIWMHLATLLRANSLDPQGKTGQLTRLKGQGMEMMGREKIKTCTVGELTQYLQVLLGVTNEDIAKELKLSNPRIEDLVHDRLPQHVVTAYIDLFMHHFQLPQNEPLIQVLQRKAHGLSVAIANEDFQDLLSGRYVVADPSRKRKARLSSRGKPGENIGQSVAVLRTRGEMTQHQLAQASGLHESKIGQLEAGIFIPRDETLLKIAKGLGLDIHHPETHALFVVVERTRRQRDGRRKQRVVMSSSGRA